MVSPVKIWRNQGKVRQLLGKTGRIVSWTFIRLPPTGFSAQAPYPVVLVKFDAGGMFTAQLVDWEKSDLTIGTRVVTVVRKIIEPTNEGVIPYGVKVKPV